MKVMKALNSILFFRASSNPDGQGKEVSILPSDRRIKSLLNLMFGNFIFIS